jgi:beta-fructofuranosidase
MQGAMSRSPQENNSHEIGNFCSPRQALTGDPHRPLYHFLAPANWMNDPNGPIFWKGKYHLFYQYNPKGAFWGTIHWGHAASVDLVHWEDYPIALSPSPNGPDKDGCWSGCVVDHNGTATALYTAPGPQVVCLATSDDSELRNWTKEPLPVIAGPPENVNLAGFPSITGDMSADLRDPFVWPDGDKWKLLLGSGLPGKGGAALLYESKDLRNWTYLGPFFVADLGDDCKMWECPVLVRDRHRCVLLVCPHPEFTHIEWFGGDFDGSCLTERARGRYDLGAYAYAVQTLEDPARGRTLLWTWIKEGRRGATRREAGWAGVISLPKECSIDENCRLQIRPARELQALRREQHTVQPLRLTPASENPFAGLTGDTLEIEIDFAVEQPAVVEWLVRCTPDREEYTSIRYDSTEMKITMDASHSSLDPTCDRQSFQGSLEPDCDGTIRLRLFLDRSVLELLMENAPSITQRVYPTRVDSTGLVLAVQSGVVFIRHLIVWRMASIW